MARIITNILLLLSFGAKAQPEVVFWALNQMPTSNKLLDNYTSPMAVSVDKLSTSYSGACMQVKRSSDNTTSEIGFVNDHLDTATLKTFVGAGNGWVTRWYNQGTQGGYFQNTTNEIFIVNSGTLVTVGGKAAVQTAANTTTANMSANGTLSFNATTVFTVAKVDAQTTVNYVLYNSAGTPVGLYYNGSLAGVNGLGGYDGTNLRSLTGEDLNRHLGYFNLRSGNLYVAKDGAAETNAGTFLASTINSSSLSLGRPALSTVQFFGKWQEVILFAGDQSSNKSLIETNINSRFAIY